MNSIGNNSSISYNSLLGLDQTVSGPDNSQAAETAKTVKQAPADSDNSKDVLEQPAKAATAPKTVNMVGAALVKPDYYKTTGIISNAPSKADHSSWQEVKARGSSAYMPTFANKAELDSWIADNINSAADINKVWNNKFYYDNSHMHDIFAYSVLDSFNRRGLVCREDAITKTYMFNQIGKEAHAVAYAEGDNFHVIAFYKNDNGKWNVSEYGTDHQINANSYEEALAQFIPGANNFWEWSDAGADGTPVVAKRIRTHHGMELAGFITGNQNGDISLTDEKGVSVTTTSEMIQAHLNLGSGWAIDARYNLPGTDGNTGVGGTMGNQSNSVWLAGRKSFGEGKPTISLALGYADETQKRTIGHETFNDNPLLMAAVGLDWQKNIYSGSFFDDKLRVSVDADNKLSLPVYFNNNFNANYFSMTLMDVNASSLVSAKAEYDVSSFFTVGASYNANIDYIHTLTNTLMSRSAGPLLNPLEMPVSRFTELSAILHGDNFNLGASVYMPITTYDTAFSDKFTWNVQGAVKVNDDVSLYGSLSGNFEENGLNAVEAGIKWKNLSAGLSATGLNTEQPVYNLSASLKFNF